MPRLHGSRSAFRGGVDQQPRRGLAARHPGKDQDRSFRKKKVTVTMTTTSLDASTLLGEASLRRVRWCGGSGVGVAGVKPEPMLASPDGPCSLPALGRRDRQEYRRVRVGSVRVRLGS